MIIILGLILLVVAAVVAVAGIFSNTGSAHALTNAFTVFGHHMTGSTGTLFLYGIIVGAAGMLGLGLLLTGARRGAVARHGLRHSRRETAAVREHRDELVEQRDGARAQATSAAEERDTLAEQRDDLIAQQDRAGEQTVGTPLSPPPPGNNAPHVDDEPVSGNGHRRPHLLGHRSGSR
ncbi:hypothetical protein P3T37_006073 [Kitasatospora sp. MAA4]|uniref:hypothetical protein n=1 Tax=Kitasatospora sp. MAA4 TaxID=3035093 RepID=UPI002476FB7E|nr:hypothetical protein [Kitasatospora sp. MAA4]MDH6136642.1 hypothetical protein [Kitasatospora sp. MAA4]